MNVNAQILDYRLDRVTNINHKKHIYSAGVMWPKYRDRSGFKLVPEHHTQRIVLTHPDMNIFATLVKENKLLSDIIVKKAEQVTFKNLFIP